LKHFSHIVLFPSHIPNFLAVSGNLAFLAQSTFSSFVIRGEK